MFDTVKDAAIIVDADTGIILDVNAQAESLLKRPREEIIGLRQYELHPPEKKERYKRAFKEHATNSEYVARTGFIVTKTGKHIPVEVVANVFQKGNQRFVLGLFRDIRKRWRAEKKLQEAQKKLQRSYNEVLYFSEMKSNLVTFASHELKTPLVPILGWAELLDKALKAGKKIDDVINQEDVKSILNSAERLNRIINNFLDLGLLEKNSLQIHRQEYKLKDLVQNAIKNIEYFIHSQNNRLSVQVQDDILNVDVFRIEQVFINILSNAIKYSPPQSEIQIKSIREEFNIKIIFTDQGYGFAPEELQTVGLPFTKTRSLKKGGSVTGIGIGLYLSKGIVELHGGKLEVFSEGLDKGSSVVVTLPLE